MNELISKQKDSFYSTVPQLNMHNGEANPHANRHETLVFTSVPQNTQKLCMRGIARDLWELTFDN